MIHHSTHVVKTEKNALSPETKSYILGRGTVPKIHQRKLSLFTVVPVLGEVGIPGSFSSLTEARHLAASVDGLSEEG